MPQGERMSGWGQGSWYPPGAGLRHSRFSATRPLAGGKASRCTRQPKNGQDQDTRPSPVTSVLRGKQHRAAQVAMSGIPQPAGPPKTECVFLRRCATVTTPAYTKKGELCSPRSHLHAQPFACLGETVVPLSSSPVSALGCSRGHRKESSRITGSRLSTATCTLLTLEICHATSTSIPWDRTNSPQMDRRLVVSIGPSICQQMAIMPVTSIRMWTRRNQISAGTWGQGLFDYQDSPQSPHEPEGQGCALSCGDTHAVAGIFLPYHGV